VTSEPLPAEDHPAAPDADAVATDAVVADAVNAESGAAAGPEPAGPQDTDEAGPDLVDFDEADAVADDLPELAEDGDLEAALEALLLIVDVPAHEDLLAAALDQPVTRVAQALRRMAAAYTENGRGIDLRRFGGGWRFYTRDVFAPFVEKLLLDGQRAKLTRAALETLAVIAYRQPVARARVAAVRGVNVDGVIRTLLTRGLVEEAGTDADTGGILYRTTELFLERLGLTSLEDLPAIAPLLPEVDAIDDVTA
jgi:segregation and condensation protein B